MAHARRQVLVGPRAEKADDVHGVSARYQGPSEFADMDGIPLGSPKVHIEGEEEHVQGLTFRFSIPRTPRAAERSRVRSRGVNSRYPATITEAKRRPATT